MDNSENKNSQKNRSLIALIVAIVAVVIICFLAGYKAGKESAAKDSFDSVTFYAVVADTQDQSVTVQGLEVNDINYRGEFVFFIEDDTELTWRGTEISVDDLDVGDTISITYSGYTLESYPAILQDVYKVQILDDEL